MQRYVHISARLTTIFANGAPQTIVVRPGTTLNVGSNKRKRARFVAKKAFKAKLRATKRARLAQRYEAHLDACSDFDAMKIAQEAEAA